MRLSIRKSAVTLGAAGALTMFGLFVATPAHAAVVPANRGPAASTVATRPQIPMDGVCFSHWQDFFGNDLTYATFTCLLTGDSVWQAYVQCTDDTVYYSSLHTGAGNDQLNCPAGSVAINAGVEFY